MRKGIWVITLAVILVMIGFMAETKHTSAIAIFLTLEQSVRYSEYIVIGTITNENAIVDPNGWPTHTLYTISIEKVIKGKNSVDNIVIKVFGGIAGDKRTEATDQPYLVLKKRYLLFLGQTNENGVYAILQGIYYSNIDGYDIAVASTVREILNTMERCGIPPAFSNSSKPESVTQDYLVKKSDCIVTGKVNMIYEYSRSYTHESSISGINLVLEKVIKGQLETKEIRISTQLGKWSELEEWIWKVPTLRETERVLLFLKVEKQGEYSVLGGSDGVLCIESKWKKPDGTEDKLLNRITNTMRNNNVAIALPLKEWIGYPPPAPVWTGFGGLVAIFFAFGGVLDVIVIRRRRRGLPSIIDKKRWNLIDCFIGVTLFSSLIFALYLIAFTSNPWWFGLIVLAIFWGLIAPLVIKRFAIRISRTIHPA